MDAVGWSQKWGVGWFFRQPTDQYHGPVSDLVQVQARALGDPTRSRLFRYLAVAAAPVGVAELTEHIGLHHNAVRQHLTKLVDAGLVVERIAPPSGPGRPPLVYEVDPAADGRWGVAGPYERLALWLAEIVRTGDAPVEVGRRVGRRQRLGTSVPADGVAVLAEQMARQGFDPTVRRRGVSVEIVLGTCPFETTAVADPDTVCQLHLGIAQGIAEDLDDVAVDALEPKDPRRAHCVLRCHTDSPG